jgi:hypothetical protein
MNLVEVQDGKQRVRSKKRGEVELIEGGEEDLVSEQSVAGTQNMAVMQFEANLLEGDGGNGGAKKKKKKKVKKVKKEDEESLIA